MSYAVPAGHPEAEDAQTEPLLEYWDGAVAPGAAPAQTRRSTLIPIAFVLPVLLSGVSWMCGGLAPVTDIAMLIVAVLCAGLLVVELLAFGSRQGVGAILIYGGVLVWFIHDYMGLWFMHDFHVEYPQFPGVTAELIARVAFYHCLFIDLMLIGFRVPLFRWADRLVVGVPEPANRRFYIVVVLVFLAVGLSAYYFTAEPMLFAILKVPFQLWVGPVEFTVWRTGNLNFSWGGYVAQLLQMGQVAGLLGVAYSLMVARTWLGKAFGWLIWGYWTMSVLPAERRGELAFMVLPPVGLIFIKYHAQAAAQLHRRSMRALVVVGILCILIWGGVARETATRNGEKSISFFRVAGNSMFSEGLRAWELIPGQVGFANDTFAGATIVRPIPDSIWALVSGLVPRALWTTKGGMDEFNIWYNYYISGDKRMIETGGVQGTTIASGAVGYWFFRYGTMGVIEGGLFFGWLMGVTERAMRRANGRPLKLLFGLSFATFMFRSYRDLWWHNLDAVILGGILLTIVIYAFFGVDHTGYGPMAPPQWALLEPDPESLPME